MDSLTLEILRSSLDVHEGDKLKVYDDATGKPLEKGDTLLGNPTIGRGRNLADPGISQEESDMMITNDITRVQRELDTRLPWWSTKNNARQLAIAELAFNLGIDKLIAKWPKTVEFLRIDQYDSATNEIMNNHVWVDEVGTERAVYIAKLVASGQLPNGR